MKILTYILSTYMVLLAAYPCFDGMSGSHEDVQVLSLEHTSCPDTTPEEDHDHEEGLCSPLCICNCCQTLLVVEYPTIIPLQTLPDIRQGIITQIRPDILVRPLFRPPISA